MRAMSERNPLFSWRLELRRSAGKLSSGRESLIAVDSLLFLGEGPPFPETRMVRWVRSMGSASATKCVAVAVPFGL